MQSQHTHQHMQQQQQKGEKRKKLFLAEDRHGLNRKFYIEMLTISDSGGVSILKTHRCFNQFVKIKTSI